MGELSRGVNNIIGGHKHEKIKVLLLWQRNQKWKTFPQNVSDR